MYLKLSNGKSHFNIICMRKKGMLVLKNSSDAHLNLICASLNWKSRVVKRTHEKINHEKNRILNSLVSPKKVWFSIFQRKICSKILKYISGISGNSFQIYPGAIPNICDKTHELSYFC